MTITTFDIIELLKNHEWISGQQIAEELTISRTAVWKHIQQLRKKGYQITAKPNLGYHLEETPQMLTIEEIKHDLDTTFIGQQIRHIDSVSSTNDYAKDLAKKGEPEGSIIIANEQKQGRGRKQRFWASPKGGLWFSIILRPHLLPSDAMQITMCAACAMIESIHHNTNLHPSIKWPNDVLINNKKLCGILTEISVEQDGINYLLVGIGLNVNNKLPEELTDISTSLQKEANQLVNMTAILKNFLTSFERLYLAVKKGNISLIQKTWMDYSSTIGSNVKIITEKEIVKGTAIDLGSHGELIVRTDQGKKTIITGDISYL